MSPLELLQLLNDLDEHPKIEAKEGSQAGKSMLETVCAFANEPGLGGGWLLLGVRAEPDVFWRQYEVVGVGNPDKVQADLTTQCASVFNVPVRPQFEIAEVQGKRLVAIFIPEAPVSAKPVFFASQGLPRGAFRRIGSADIRCTEEDLAIFYGDRPSHTLDLAVLPDGEMEEIDPALLAEYRRLRGEANPAAEELKWGDEELLRALRGAGRDPRGILRPTVAGILLFGTTQGLRRHFPMMRVDYIRVPGRRWIEDPDRRFETVELRVPLVRVVGRAIATILDDLPKAFSLPPDAVHRRELPRIPARVLREAVVNAVMHRSYREHGAVQIIRYANRLEIRNPGYSLVAEERWGEPGSVTRNPHIAAVLHEINLAETKGSGIRVMRQLMRDAGLTPPTFESDRQKNCFVATFLFHHFLGPDDWEWLHALDVPGLSDEDARALVFVRETGAIDNAAYRDINQVDALNASLHLRRLRDRGLLEQKGKGSATFYVPSPQFLRTLEQEETDLPAATADPLSGQSDSLSGKASLLSGKAEPLSGMVAPQSGMAGPLSGKVREHRWLPPGLPADLVRELSSMKARVSQPEMEDVVWRLCVWRPFSIDELARTLRRNRKYIATRLVTPMLRAGRMEMTLPDQPKHPQQTYRAVGPAAAGSAK